MLPISVIVKDREFRYCVSNYDRAGATNRFIELRHPGVMKIRLLPAELVEAETVAETAIDLEIERVIEDNLAMDLEFA